LNLEVDIAVGEVLESGQLWRRQNLDNTGVDRFGESLS
jgi:hypothetical protein